ncbi:MAG: hypothetical protein WC007_09880 [Pelobacteraceae bacterium]
MKNQGLSTIAMVVMMTALLSFTGSLAGAAQAKPMKPELAAKREMVRQQREQRVTDAQRRTAADALKAERLRVHQAKQLVKKMNQENNNNK